MDIDTRYFGDKAAVRPTGDIDMATSPELRRAVFEAIRERKGGIVVLNLAGVHYIDSSAVATLIECLRMAASHQIRFRLAGLNEGPRKVLSMTLLLDLFEVHASEEQALQA